MKYVEIGLSHRKACDTAIVAGAVWADDPVLNPTPPPDDFDRSDAQQGCLDQLTKRLGY